MEYLLTGNSVACNFIIETIITDVPIPTINLAKYENAMISVTPNSIEPIAVTAIPTVQIFLTPMVSTMIPTGSCINA